MLQNGKDARNLPVTFLFLSFLVLQIFKPLEGSLVLLSNPEKHRVADTLKLGWYVASFFDRRKTFHIPNSCFVSNRTTNTEYRFFPHILQTKCNKWTYPSHCMLYFWNYSTDFEYISHCEIHTKNLCVPFNVGASRTNVTPTEHAPKLKSITFCKIKTGTWRKIWIVNICTLLIIL